MKKLISVSVIAALAGAFLIAGCNSKSASYDSRREEPVYEAAETQGAVDSHNMYAADRAAGADVEWEYDYGYDESYDFKDMSATSGGTNQMSGQSSVEVSNQVNVDPEQGRLLIRTVSMTAETKEFSKVRTDVEAQIKSLGGYIEYSSMAGTGNDRDLRSVFYTVRIPADQLDALLENVGNSCTILSSSESTSDVTLEYVDTKARIESLRVEYDQLLELLDNAGDLDTIIILQSRISDVRYEIECYESRIRVLENQVLYATLNLTLTEVLEETEVEEAHVVTYGEKVSDQFADTWENTKIFFQNLLLDIIAAIPALIVLAVFIIAGLIVLFVLRGKRKKARAAKAAALKAAEEETKESVEEVSKEESKDEVKE